MIELPEAHTLANQIAHHLSGKMASSTTAAQSHHKSPGTMATPPTTPQS
jgi:hypothetical protein